MRNKWWAKILRFIGIVLMGLTSAFTLMGGAGTTCVALNPTGYEGKFSGIAPYQWLYILFVLVTIAIGVLGVRATVNLVKGTRSAWRDAIVALVAGVLVGGIHIYASRVLRGGSMPVDMVAYTTLITFVYFYILRIPPIWQGANFEKPASQSGQNSGAAAIALGLCGLLSLIIQFLMAPTHTVGGVNYADAWHLTLTSLGVTLILAGTALGFRQKTLRRHQPQTQALSAE